MIEGSESINRDTINALPKDDLYFYVWGEVKYHDGFRRDRYKRSSSRFISNRRATGAADRGRISPSCRTSSKSDD
jgi:hypothetical protein